MRMKRSIHKNSRRGAALLMVLFIVMAITLISFGLISQSDMELACGNNMAVRAQTDYLVQSALTHAKAVITNPQDVDTDAGYWQGGSAFQIEDDSSDYYDISVSRDSSSGSTYRCTYDIECEAYRQVDGQQVAESVLIARLRLDPCIALWTGGNMTVPHDSVVNGDIYCNGELKNSGTVNGDVFANSLRDDPIAGQLYQRSEVKVVYPAIETNYFFPNYYSDSGSHTARILAPGDYNDIAFSPSSGNPAGVIYCNGDIELSENVTINGTLVVNGYIKISGPNISITSSKNFPAIVTSGKLEFKNTGSLTVSGLAQVDTMSMTGSAGDINILGALFIAQGGMNVDANYTANINITAAPVLASVKVFGDSENASKWTPIGDAFFKSIARN